MRRWWTILFAAVAIGAAATTAAHAAPPSDSGVESDAIAIPPGEGEAIDPGSMDAEDEADEAAPGTADLEAPAGPAPAIEYDLAKLPPPVRRIREQIVEAAATGDVEKLRPIFEANEEPPVLSLTETDDPIDHLKSLAGDPEGREILAILIEVLDAGYVHVDVGTPEEMYVWPYFARYPLEELTGPQMVELFKLLTAGDYEDMKIYGTYLFYRVGIAPNGVWKYFVAGD